MIRRAKHRGTGERRSRVERAGVSPYGSPPVSKPSAPSSVVPAIVRQVVLCGLLMIPMGLASADEPFPHYDTWLEGVVQVDDGGLGGSGSAMLPLWYDQSSLLFADLRGVSDSNDRAGANLGVGFRHLTAADWIIGAYGFYDRLHLAGDAAINQGVLGIELMNVDWEFRVNGYLPESFERSVGRPVNHISTYDGWHYIASTTYRIEGTYRGADFELGCLLHDWNAGDIELRGYVGGYHFDRNDSRFEAITGPRVRAELRIYDLPSLGPQSRLVATGQYQWDEVRGSQGLVSIGVRVAFGDRSSTKLSRIRRRMLDTIPRQRSVVPRVHWTKHGPTEDELASFWMLTTDETPQDREPRSSNTFRPTSPDIFQLR